MVPGTTLIMMFQGHNNNTAMSDRHAIDAAFTDQTKVTKLQFWLLDQQNQRCIVNVSWSQAEVTAEETQTHPAH